MYNIDYIKQTEYGWKMSGWRFDDEQPDVDIMVSLPGFSRYTVTYIPREDVIQSIARNDVKYDRMGFIICVYEPYKEKFLIQFTQMEDVTNAKLLDVLHQKAAQIKHILAFKPSDINTSMYISDIEPLQKSSYDLQHYHEWWQLKKITAVELERQKSAVFAYEPLVSILVPLYNTDGVFLREMLDSVLQQSYPKWQLCLADGSTEGYVWEIVQEYAEKDSRIVASRIKNTGIAGNTNECLSMAEGEYIAFLDHDDFLEPNALFEIVTAINSPAKPEFIYSDEDKFNIHTGRYEDMHLKPDFSWQLFYLSNFICHFTAIKKSLLERAGGGFDSECDGAQDYDMFLRCAEQTDYIHHIPKVLYHWRIHDGSTAGKDNNAKPYAYYAGVKALQKHIKRKGIKAKVQEHDSFYYDVFY